MKSKVYECHTCLKTPCRLQIFEEFVIPDRCPYGNDNNPEWEESDNKIPNKKKDLAPPKGYMKNEG